MPNIAKLDQKIIALEKAICGLPKSTPNITTKLPPDQFGLNAYSLKTEYLTCIGKQLCNALNDPGRLGIIYIGLTNHVLAKYGGSENLPLLNKEACLHSPTTRTLYLLKHNGLTSIMNEKEFQQYHKGPTPTIKKALKIASQIFCATICTNTCRIPCNIHQQSCTLLPEIANRPNQTFYHNPLPENNPIVDI
jgi:hypothetical protein